MDFVPCFRITPYLFLQILIVTLSLFVVFRGELQWLGYVIHSRCGLLVYVRDVHFYKDLCCMQSYL